ncbi:hypothetical protein PRZ48_012900 [Zasmidium cellare]|uniref:Uncharacterized protein n=1 Tax=Zasmidium cellare TaxID=395010 RepID=A0ABR0E2I9_ZASCE|nr:hypothetical protein PRZ48_012900 [Zasmidium cellare]
MNFADVVVGSGDSNEGETVNIQPPRGLQGAPTIQSVTITVNDENGIDDEDPIDKSLWEEADEHTRDEQDGLVKLPESVTVTDGATEMDSYASSDLTCHVCQFDVTTDEQTKAKNYSLKEPPLRLSYTQ